MVPHVERIHDYIRSLKAVSSVFPLPGRHFHPLFSRQFFVAESSSTSPQRELTSDGEDVPTSRRRTTNQKNVHLELMLGQVVIFCPVISRNTIVKNSTSVKSICKAKGLTMASRLLVPIFSILLALNSIIITS